jgi:hypothetical protein
VSGPDSKLGDAAASRAPLRRYGKPSADVIGIKQSFFQENDRLLAWSRYIGEVYRHQPIRIRCKCCDGGLDAAGLSFAKQGIDYIICPRCGHLNGRFEDTAEFCAMLYADGDGEAYATNYAAEDRAAFDRRVGAIYAPKAQFLLDALEDAGADPGALRYADIGAGSGYFVAALRGAGLHGAVGYEVSDAQRRLAAAMLGGGAVEPVGIDAEAALAARLDAEVVSLIGVLEHVRRPRELLAALRANTAIQYVYLSVPLFSPSVYFEMAFPEVMQRQLSGGHTHLYTESSLDWTCREFGFGRAGEWWFGTDLVDLYRSVLVSLESRPELRAMTESWSRGWAPVIDEMQLVLDRNKLSSEVHLLLQA